MTEFMLDIEEGFQEAPLRIAVIGEGGLGKTTFASCAPYPIVLDLERGSKRFQHIGRNKSPIETWENLRASIDWLRTSKHPYKTVVIDTLDRAEWLCWKHVCETDRVASIEQVGKGFGKGYTASYEEFRGLFSKLEKLGEDRDMHVIILAHPKVEKVQNPSGADYGRYTFKVHSSVGNLMFEACDHVLFAARNTVVTDEVFDEARHRAIGGEQRVLRTTGGPTWVAKSRDSIPDKIPFSFHTWACFLAAAQPGYPRLLRETVVENARRLGNQETIAKVADLVANEKQANYVKLLAQANKRLMELIGGFPDQAPPKEVSQQPAGHAATTSPDASKSEPAKQDAKPEDSANQPTNSPNSPTTQN